MLQHSREVVLGPGIPGAKPLSVWTALLCASLVFSALLHASLLCTVLVCSAQLSSDQLLSMPVYSGSCCSAPLWSGEPSLVFQISWGIRLLSSMKMESARGELAYIDWMGKAQVLYLGTPLWGLAQMAGTQCRPAVQCKFSQKCSFQERPLCRNGC